MCCARLSVKKRRWSCYGMSKNTTTGLAELLRRHGVTPTGNPSKDIKLARGFMPAPYNNKESKTNE